MLSRLKKIAKRAGAIIVAGIVTLTALPVIPVQVAETKNYKMLSKCMILFRKQEKITRHQITQSYSG